jgi:hypothetical protein
MSTFGGCSKKTTSDLDWSSLKKINIADSLLFKSMTGCMIEGTIITRVCIMTSVMFLVQDSQGEISVVGLYNYIKDQSKFKLSELFENLGTILYAGVKIQIAEPFYKAAMGGNRMIRIDDPREFRIIKSDSVTVSKAKQNGNQAFVQKNYSMAIDHYKKCFGNMDIDLFVELLEERSSQFLKLKLCAEALADCSCILMLRPENEKIWRRYCAILRLLGMSNLAVTVKGQKNAKPVGEWCDPENNERYLALIETILKAGSGAFQGEIMCGTVLALWGGQGNPQEQKILELCGAKRLLAKEYDEKKSH